MSGRRPLCFLAVLLFFFPQVAAGIEVPLNSRGLHLRKHVSGLRELKTRYIIFQQYDFSCGAAVISTLLTYYFGEPASEKRVILGIAKKADMKKVLRRRAFSLLDLKRFAQAMGYKALGYRMNFGFLVRKLKGPVIVPVVIRGYDHFVIFKGLVGDRVVIADPALGNYTLRVGRFLSVWKRGVGFVLKRKKPRGPLTEEDLRRRVMFMGHRDLGHMVTSDLTHSFARIPGHVQSITGPSPPGGSFLEFFNIQIPSPPPPPTVP